MIDALLYAVRDGIRAGGMSYGVAECEIMDDGRPTARAGNFFLAIHDGAMRSVSDNQLNELYSFSATLSMRLTVPLDRVGDQQLARNIARVPLGIRQGFYAKADQIRAFLHMNWAITVQPGQTPNSANDNLVQWSAGMPGVSEVYGFNEPMRFRSMENPKLVYADWFQNDPTSDDPQGLKAMMTFADCRRFQPVTKPSGPFV